MWPNTPTLTRPKISPQIFPSNRASQKPSEIFFLGSDGSSLRSTGNRQRSSRFCEIFAQIWFTRFHHDFSRPTVKYCFARRSFAFKRLYKPYLIGGVSIREDASPRQSRPGGHCLAPVITFSKILTFPKFRHKSFLNAKKLQNLSLELHTASGARIDTSQRRKTINFVITTKNVTQCTNLDATKDFSTDFSQQPRFTETFAHIFSWIWRKLVKVHWKSTKILTI